MYSAVKCRNCRNLILERDGNKSLFLNAHGAPLGANEDECDINSFIFLNEDSLPPWMKLRIEEENWAKGKINCPGCDSRIGAFNFIAGHKCHCSQFVLPFVHIIKSKVDLIKS